MRKLILAAALAGIAGAGVAIAQPGPQGPGRHAPTTRTEAAAAADARFARLDANRDGRLSANERPQRRGNAPAVAQTVTRDQFRVAALAKFDRVDTNRNGRIDGAEQLRKHRRGGDRMAHRGKGGGAGRMLAMADANRDGAITRAEAAAAMNAMFDRADTNRDGRIDAAERTAVGERMGRRGGGDRPQPPRR